MKKDQFLDIMDGIGDDLIEDFLDIPGKRFSAPKKTPLWKIGISAAAAVCVLTAGVFGVVKLRGLPHSANSGVTISNDNSSYVSEPVSSDNSSDAESGNERDDSEKRKLERVFTNGIPFYFKVSVREKTFSDTCRKTDEENFAVVRFKMLSHVYENKPLYVNIIVDRKEEGGVIVGSAVIKEEIIEPFTIEYTEKVEKGELVYLTVYGGSGNTEAAGQWLP